MRAIVDPELCTGCELCVENCPEVFEMEGDVARPILDEVPVEAMECCREVAEDCPVEAISIQE